MSASAGKKKRIEKCEIKPLENTIDLLKVAVMLLFMGYPVWNRLKESVISISVDSRPDIFTSNEIGKI